MSDSQQTDDIMIVKDRASRRRFIRRGAGFVLAGGATLTAAGNVAGNVLVADCDSGGEGCETSCSDSDSGENSDPTGRGKRCSSISISQKSVDVTRIKG